MRKLVLQMQVSLDGFAGTPSGMTFVRVVYPKCLSAGRKGVELVFGGPEKRERTRVKTSSTPTGIDARLPSAIKQSMS